VVMGVAVGEGQRPHPLGIERRENLSNASAAVVADQVDLIDLQGIEHLFQHLRVGSYGDILIRRDLGVAMGQEIHRMQRRTSDSPANWCRHRCLFSTTPWTKRAAGPEPAEA